MKQVAAIGLRLEHVLNNHRDMRSGLSYCFHDNSNNIKPCRICDEVSGGNNNKIAHIISLGSAEIYCIAKQIYLEGRLELLEALDENRISIVMPAKLGPCISSQQETIRM